jgi:N-acetylneuraminic acid mutarotase
MSIEAIRKVLMIVVFSMFLWAVAGGLSVHATETSFMSSNEPMHQARDNLGVAVVNGKIYAIGIEGGGSIEEYDPSTNTWAFKAPMPIPRFFFATAVYQNRIYCMGGAIACCGSGFIVSGENEVYDPATNTWATKEPLPTARANLQANVIDGRIYAIGGTKGNTPSNITEVYDPITDSWTSKSSMPVTYDCANYYTNKYVSSVVNNKIFILSSGLTEIYDVDNDSWSLGTAPPPFGNALAGGATAGVFAPQRIYIFTTENTGFDSRSTPVFKTQIYDPQTDSWTTSSSPNTRFGLAVAVLDDKLYLIGGHTVIPDKPPYLHLKFISSAENTLYTPIGYGSIPPAISIISPRNTTYESSNISLAYNVNKPVSWISYSLDGQANVTVTGNTTITGLVSGLHKITVYTKDPFENIGVSETIPFETSTESFPTANIAAFSGVTAVAAMIGVVYYSRKRSGKKLSIK